MNPGQPSSSRREQEMFQKINQMPVNDRAAVFKYWAYVGYLFEKNGFLNPEKLAKDKKGEKGRTKQSKNHTQPPAPAAAAEALGAPPEPIQAPEPPKSSETPPNSEYKTRAEWDYEDATLGGAEDLGLSF